MLKDLFNYFKEHNRPEIVEAADHIYSTRALERLDIEQNVRSLEVRSLSGLIDYIKSDFDTERPFMVHIVNPTTVRLFDALNIDNERRTYVEAMAMLPSITFGRFMDLESFNIQLQAKFVSSEDSKALLQMTGSIVEDEGVTTEDNGVSQKVIAKTGVATRGEVEVPNPCILRPIRTFVEIAQPESSFVLRLQKGPQAALFEADGGAWEISAMHSIKEYLSKELEGLIENKKVIVIA